jgi:hypothetical protein
MAGIHAPAAPPRASLADHQTATMATRHGEAAAVSPDGTRIAFLSDRTGVSNVFVVAVDGTGETQVTHSSAETGAPAWTADGRHRAPFQAPKGTLLTRLQFGLGVVGSSILATLGIVHSVFGWSAATKTLLNARLAADFIAGLSLAWQLAGVGTILAGLVSLKALVDTRRAATGRGAVLIVGSTYVAYSAWTFLVAGVNPVGLMFLVPAVMLMASAIGSHRA